jgi:hypothetical protein
MQIPFFVYIIESPSAKDFLDNRGEGVILQSALSLAGVSSQLTMAVNTECFREALADRFRSVIQQKFNSLNPQLPVLHLSTHGGTTGLQCTDGSMMTWDELANLLRPLNQLLGGCLVVCISSCESFNACRMAMKLENLPFLFMVGNSGAPLWSDTAIGFATFYHHWAKGKPFGEALNAMKIASGDQNFVCVSASTAQQAFVEQLNLQTSLPFSQATD